MDLERRLRALATGSRSQAFRVEVSGRTASLLIGSGAGRLAEIEAVSKKRFFFVPKEGAHADHLAVLEEGKLVDIQPASPVAEGSELDLKLVELGLHDASAAVGKLDGLDVIVGGAAKLVGKKAKVRIERVLDGSAYATLLAGGVAVPDAITFESEAEKPTRAPARSKKVAEDATEPALEEQEAEVVVEQAEVDQEDADQQDVSADGAAPVKKKTRRGSRGGRNRKKKPVAGTEDEGLADAAEAADVAAEDELEAASARTSRTPRIHVPASDLDGEAPKPKPRSRAKAVPATDEEAPVEAVASDPESDAEVVVDGEQPVKKKTRRGSRGGRNRKKKPVVAGGNGDAPEAAEAAQPDEPAQPAAVAAPSSEPSRPEPVSDEPKTGSDEYVPMSEWGDEI
jgi:hypothetical protein